jgi:hypothetical protein
MAGPDEGEAMQVVRKIAVGIAAAIAVGAVCGGVARIMMRLVNVVAGHESSFSIGGTLGIMMIFALFALPGALLATFLRRRGRSALLVLGALALCVPATATAAADLEGVFGLSAMQWVGVGLWTAGVYTAIAAMPFVALRTITAMTEPRRAPVAAVAAHPLGA